MKNSTTCPAISLTPSPPHSDGRITPHRLNMHCFKSHHLRFHVPLLLSSSLFWREEEMAWR